MWNPLEPPCRRAFHQEQRRRIGPTARKEKGHKGERGRKEGGRGGFEGAEKATKRQRGGALRSGDEVARDAAALEVRVTTHDYGQLYRSPFVKQIKEYRKGLEVSPAHLLAPG